MARKSKTQRAKASARRAERREAAVVSDEELDAADGSSGEGQAAGEGTVKKSQAKASVQSPQKVEIKKADAPKKESWIKRNSFIQGVKSELRRVTWPTRQDVLRWSGVVVVALLFFSAFVFVLDNWVVTPLLLLVSSIGA